MTMVMFVGVLLVVLGVAGLIAAWSEGGLKVLKIMFLLIFAMVALFALSVGIGWLTA